MMFLLSGNALMIVFQMKSMIKRTGSPNNLHVDFTSDFAYRFHAGDPVVMRKTVQMAFEKWHPAFPGLLGLGRRNMSVTPNEAYACVVYQNGKTSFTIIRERCFAF